MKSKKMVVGYAVAIFLIVFVITFNAVCSITQFDVRYYTGSSGAAASAEKIQNRLNEYLDKSYLFFDTDNVYDIVESVCSEDDTYLRVLSVEKRFPNKISVTMEEEYESYAFSSDGVYYITDANGKLLSVKDSPESNLDEGSNVEVSGFVFAEPIEDEPLVAERPALFSLMLELLTDADEFLGGIRGRFSSVELISRGSVDFFCFTFTEGVKIWLMNVSAEGNQTAVRFDAALKAYGGLSDAEKTYGYLAPVGSDPAQLPQHNPGDYTFA